MYIRKLLVSLLMVVGLTTATPLALFAQSAGDPTANPFSEYGVECDGAVCTLQIDVRNSPLAGWAPLLRTGSYVINVMQDNLRLLPDGTGIEVKDAMRVTLPIGNMQLAGADLVVNVDAEGVVQRVRGSANLPMLASLENGPLSVPTNVVFGLDKGAALSQIDAPLQADQQYLFVEIGNPQPTATKDGEHSAVKVPSTSSATIVVGADEPFTYVSGAAAMRSSTLAALYDLLPLDGADPLLAGGALLDPSLIPQRSMAGFSVLWTDDPADAQLTLNLAYGVDGSLAARWLPFDVAPLTVNAEAVVSRAGLRLDGGVHSQIAPSTVLDGSLQASLFVPFDGSQQAELAFSTDGRVPVLDWNTTNQVVIGGDDAPESEQKVETAAAPTNIETGITAQLLQSASSAAASTGNGISAAYGAISDLAGRSYAAVADSSASAVGYGADLVTDSWCALTAWRLGSDEACGDRAPEQTASAEPTSGE